MWYFSKDFADYPSALILNVPGCFTNSLIEHNGVRYEKSGIIFKQSDVSGRGMALVVPSGCQATTAYIEY